MLIAVPNLVASAVEPGLALLADAGKRRGIVLGGGVAFAAALVLTAVSPGFGALLAAFVVLCSASGAFVALSQATLMDLHPDAHERNMARWVVAGSVGVVAGPLLLAGARAAGWGWRPLMLGFAALTLAIVAFARRLPFRRNAEPRRFAHVARDAVRALRRWPVVRWLVVLQLSDLMGDVFLGFLALYLVDVASLSPVQAGLAVALWSGAGLAGDALLVPLLARVRGVRYLRWSAAAVAIVFPAFLLAPNGIKLALLVPLGLLNAGWYAVPQAGLYSEMPGASGTAVAVADVASFVGTLFPLAIGLLAQRAGLQAALWTLLLGPLALLTLLPRSEPVAKG